MDVRRPIAAALSLVFAAIIVPLHAESDDGFIGVVDKEPTQTKGGTSPAQYVLGKTLAQFSSEITTQHSQGRELVDVETYQLSEGGTIYYGGIFHPVTGTMHRLIDGTSAEWQTFITDMGALNGRWLDFEVNYFSCNSGGITYEKRYSGIFYEDGDDYSSAIRTTNSEAQFQSYLDQYQRDGQQIIDFEAYQEPGGTQRFAGIWVNDPNQPRTTLYYGLESADVSELLNPLHGRVIDIERYFDVAHGEDRWAVIMALYPGGGWAVYRGMTDVDLAANNVNFSDDNTHITDLEVYNTGSGLRYAAVWGDSYKSLNEVATVPSDTDPVDVPETIAALADDFETANGTTGTIGFFAKNIRTNQSFGYRASTPFYLASTSKLAIHIRLWMLYQSGHLSSTDAIRYTNGLNTPEPWYVDDRSLPGLSSCTCNTGTCTNGRGSDFGSFIQLSRLDSAMMQVSDNAATSMIVDDPTLGLSWDSYDLNEWLAGIDGVARGWGIVTSIQKLDRLILWQGQVYDFPDAQSYFRCPPWRFEPWFRGCGDNWGSLNAYYGEIPSTNSTDGHARYYAMGLNTAEPRAYVTLMEKFYENEFLTPTNTQNALSVMTSGATALDNDPRFPGNVVVRGKNGDKGGASSPHDDIAYFILGPDAIAMALFTKDNSRSATTVRTNYTAPIGYEALLALTADLAPSSRQSDGAATGFFVGGPDVYPGKAIGASITLANLGGGDANPFDVSIYLSTNKSISSSDYLIQTRHVSGLSGNSSQFSNIFFDMPDGVPKGAYYVGWMLDSDKSQDASFGEVGELDEANNWGYIADLTVNVVDAPCGGYAEGDFNNDCCTNIDDFLILLDHWQEDFDGNTMDINGFLNLLDHWQTGTGCP